MKQVGSKNLKKALQILESYRGFRLNKEKKDNFDINKKLLEYGFTQEELGNELIHQYLKQTTVVVREIDSSSVIREVGDAFIRDEGTCILATQRQPIVYVGGDSFNEQYCLDNNIPFYPLGYGGGTIVASDEDLGVGIVLERHDLMGYFMEKLKEWISNNIKKTTISGNDILVDNQKVVGTATKTVGNKTLYCMQVSFKVDGELISRISKKRIVKIPAGLLKFGDKTKEDLIREVKKWLR